jgi:hypothetical protein
MSDPSKIKKRVIPLRDDELLFTVSMAAAFFDVSANNFKAKEKYLFDYSGNPIEIHRTAGGDRRYSLNDILKIAHSLRRVNKMTDRQLRLIVLRVDAFKEPVKKHRLKYRKGGNPS